MEVLTALIELIPTLGFPIVCVIGLAFFIYQIYKKSEDREDKLTARLEEAQKINADAIATIGKYADSITNIKNDIKEIKQEIIVLTERLD